MKNKLLIITTLVLTVTIGLQIYKKSIYNLIYALKNPDINPNPTLNTRECVHTHQTKEHLTVNSFGNVFEIDLIKNSPHEWRKPQFSNYPHYYTCTT